MGDDSKWARYGALGGIVFVVLVVASGAAGGNSQASDSPAKILKYLHDHQDGIKIAAFLSVLATVAIIWWAGSLWARLHHSGDRDFRLAVIALLGLLIGGAGNLTQTGITAALAIELNRVTANESKFFVVLSQAFGAGGSIGIAVLVFATSVATFRYHAFPTWVGWLGVVDGLAFLVGGYSIATTNSAIGGVGFAAFILWAIWLIATSVVMFRAKDEIPATA